MFNQFIRKPLRRFLLKLIILTEEPKDSEAASSYLPTDKKRIYLPLWALGGIVWAVMVITAFALAFEPTVPELFGYVILAAVVSASFVTWLKKEAIALTEADSSGGDDTTLICFLTCLGLAGVALGMHVSSAIPAGGEVLSSFRAGPVLAVPAAAIAMLAAILISGRIAVAVTLLMLFHLAVLENFNIGSALVLFFGSLTAALFSADIRTRQDITRLGLKVALVQGLAVSALSVFRVHTMKGFILEPAWAFGGGIVSALFVLALLPVLETMFSKITNIKLLEMADASNPLLERLSLEAPGTYHHSQSVAQLAEAAAEAIGANGLLCRVGACYHDLGKIVKPEYFIENQSALGNPHDPLTPSISRLVVLSHVKEGVALAAKARINPALINFILMHHGTSRMEYFYRRALEEGQEESEEIYRYPGPKPATKETAIVMLADSVEAVSRTLGEPTPQRLQDSVYKILNNKFIDGQLDEAPVTLGDLHRIAESFINTLVTIHHGRIQYPEPAAEAQT